MVNIYLAGSIDGLSYEEACGWRILFTEELNKDFPDQIEILDPTAKYHGKYKDGDILDIRDCTLLEAGRIYKKDLDMINRTDLMVAYISKHSRGIGTIFEFGYAKAKGIPVVAYVGNPQLAVHPFVWNSAYCIIDNPDPDALLRLTKSELIFKFNLAIAGV